MPPLLPGNILEPHERIELDGLGGFMTGYVYHVFLNGVDKGWIPFNPNTFSEPLQFAYSILVEDLTVGVEENEKTEAVSLYPNPGTGEVWLNLELGTISSGDVQVFDPNGRIVFFKNISQSTTLLELQHLNAGIYTVRVAVENSYFHLPYVKL